MLTANGAAHKVGVGHQSLELANNLIGAVRVDVLVVVSGEKGASVLRPEVLLDLLDGGCSAGVLDTKGGDDVQPGNDSPQTILLTDVVATSSETLLTADGQLLRVEEGAEELPAGRDLVAGEALCLGNQVDGAAGGHGSGKTVDAVLLEVGDELGVVGNDGERVSGRYKGVGAVNHVSVTITIGSGTKGNIVLVDNLDQGVGVGEVRVGVPTVKVGAGNAVLGGTSESKLLLKDGLAVGASDSVKAIKQDLEVGVGGEELLDGVKVKDVLEHGDVVGGAVDDLNLEGAIGGCANGGDVDVGDGSKLIRRQGLGRLVDLVGNGFRSGTAVGQVVLDAEIVRRA